MRLKPFELSQHLSSPLKPIYWVSGDEPLQLGEACDAIRAAARNQEYGVREIYHVDRDFQWQQLTAAAQSLSLFSERRLLELRLNGAKLDDAGRSALVEYASRPPEDTVLLISGAKLEASVSKAKWFNEVMNQAVLIQVWPVEHGELPAWIGRRLQQKGFQATAEVARFLAERVEGNLLAAVQEIEKLFLLTGGGRLDMESVVAAVSDSARYDVFVLADACLAGNGARVARIVTGLEEEGVAPTLVLWSLAKDARTAALLAFAQSQGQALEALFPRMGVWDKRKPLFHKALGRFRAERWQDLLRLCTRVDKVIKGQAPGNPWQELLQLALRMAGVKAPSPPRTLPL